MAIVKDNSASATDTAATLTFAHTCTGTGTNGILIVAIQVTDSVISERFVQSVTHNGEALTPLWSTRKVDASDGLVTDIWYRLNPTTGGTPNIVVTAGGTCTDLTAGSISLTGVSTTSGFTVDYAVPSGTPGASNFGDGTTNYRGQSFTGNGEVLDKATVLLSKTGTPTGTVTAKLYNHTGTYGTNGTPTGSAVATSSSVNLTSVAGIADDYSNITFDFSGSRPTLDNGTKYFIIVDATGVTGDASNYISIRGLGTGGTHAGNSAYSADGSSWTASSTDHAFCIESTSITQKASGTTGPPSLSITTTGTSSFVVDSLSSGEADGTKIATNGGTAIHKTDVGADTHAASYIDAGGAGAQTIAYTDTDSDTRWVLSAVSITIASGSPPVVTTLANAYMTTNTLFWGSI